MICLRSSLVALFLLGLGCENNTIMLETDPGPSNNDTTAGSATMDVGDVTSTGAGTTAGDPNSPHTLLFALATTFNPELPYQAIVTTEPQGNTIDLTLQWLSLDQGSTTAPRLLVGAVYSGVGIPVGGDGSFFWDTGVVTLPAEAEAITATELTMNVEITGVVGPAGGPLYCGDAAGRVTVPFTANMAGSTYAMTEVTGVADLPVTFASSCP